MARQTQPTFLGVLKSNKDAQKNWTYQVWRLPNGQIRHIALKAVVVGKEAQTGRTLQQQVLVDAQGNPI
jgi:hypothetical protein